MQCFFPLFSVLLTPFSSVGGKGCSRPAARSWEHFVMTNVWYFHFCGEQRPYFLIWTHHNCWSHISLCTLLPSLSLWNASESGNFYSEMWGANRDFWHSPQRSQLPKHQQNSTETCGQWDALRSICCSWRGIQRVAAKAGAQWDSSVFSSWALTRPCPALAMGTSPVLRKQGRK